MKRPSLLFALLVSGGVSAFAQTHNVTGKVLDENGQGFPGAGIMIKGTTIGTVTDLDGNFNLDMPDDKKNKLVIQALGYVTVTVSDTGQSDFVIRMTRTSTTLEGAVVTALGIRREKRELGYSSTTVSNEELTAGNNTSALSSLQGKVAGANITSSTGGPGGSTRIVLRGEKSITGNNNAIIVVDGVITTNHDRTGSNVLEQTDFGNSANDLNPDEIESVSVLPGAAAAALYGELARNGAIMITTKKGKKHEGDKNSKMDVTYKITYTQADILKYASQQHIYGQGNLYQGLADDRRENFSWGAQFDGKLRPWGQIIDGKQLVKPYVDQPDNIRNFFNRAKTLNNYVSVSGGTDKSTYLLSISALNNTGLVPNTFYNKYSVRFNGSTQLSNSFYSSIDLNYLNTYSRIEPQGQASGSILDNLYQTARDIPVWELKDLNNKYYSMQYTDTNGVERYGYYGAYYKNPYWLAKNYDYRNKTDRIYGDYILGFKKGEFNVYNRLGIDVSSDRTSLKTPNINSQPVDPLYDGLNYINPGGFTQRATTYFAMYNDLMATYTHDFDKDFGVNAMLGDNITIDQSENLSAVIDPGTNGLVIPNFYSFTNNKGPVTTTNYLGRKRSHDVYGDVKFNFRRELFLELTGRNSWSSTLDLGHNSYFYPGANVSWVFTERLNGTDFKKKVLNYGKLRFGAAGIGKSGFIYANNAAGYTQSAIASSFGSIVPPFNGIPAYQIQSTFGTYTLKPERTREFEVGVDVGFLNNRLSGTFTYYNNLTVDQIIQAALPASSGFTSYWTNVGDVSNKGIEITGRGTPIQTRWGLTWELFGTYTRNKNNVERLNGGLENVTLGGFNGMSIVAAVGKPMGTFYGADIQYWNGHAVVDQATGLPVATTKPVYKGSYQPKYIMSWGTDLTWKGLKLHVVFASKQGGMIYSRTRVNMAFNGTSQETTVNSRNAYVWNNSVYQVGNTNNYLKNTTAFLPYNYYTNVMGNNLPLQGLVDASYVKLQEAALTYKIPSKYYAKKTPFGNLEAGVFGTNLLLWTSKSNQYNDPEEMSSGAASNGQGLNFAARPSMRNYGIYLKATF